MAKEIADKLERDLQEQKLRELKESEKVAQEMQVSYTLFFLFYKNPLDLTDYVFVDVAGNLCKSPTCTPTFGTGC